MPLSLSTLSLVTRTPNSVHCAIPFRCFTTMSPLYVHASMHHASTHHVSPTSALPSAFITPPSLPQPYYPLPRPPSTPSTSMLSLSITEHNPRPYSLPSALSSSGTLAARADVTSQPPYLSHSAPLITSIFHPSTFNVINTSAMVSLTLVGIQVFAHTRLTNHVDGRQSRIFAVCGITMRYAVCGMR